MSTCTIFEHCIVCAHVCPAEIQTSLNPSPKRSHAKLLTVTEDLGGPCNWWESRDEDQEIGLALAPVTEEGEGEEGENEVGGLPSSGMAGQSRSKSRGKSRAASSRAGSARGNFGVVRWASNELLAETLNMWDKVDPATGIELRYLPSAAGSARNGPLDETGFASSGAGSTPPGPDDATVERGTQQLQFEAVPTPPSRDDDPSRQGVAIQGAHPKRIPVHSMLIIFKKNSTD